MRVTPSTVTTVHARLREEDTETCTVINHVRDELGEAFDTEVSSVDESTYREEVDRVFADGEVAVNVATLVRLLADLDVEGDYAGFVVDEVLGRELAATIAGGRPLSLLAEATFHYADIITHGDSGDPAGLDDRHAAIAAGFQTRLPGWEWRDGESPFTVK